MTPRLKLLAALSIAWGHAALGEDQERMGFFGNIANTTRDRVQFINGELTYLEDLTIEAPQGETQSETVQLVNEPVGQASAQTKYQYHPIVSFDYVSPTKKDPASTCIRVPDTTARDLNGQNLILGSCDEYLTYGAVDDGWRYDEKFDLFRSQLNDKMCMQAGGGNRPKNGNILRLAPCNKKRKSQKFQYFPGIGIHPVTNSSLCVVWKGLTPQPGSDPIILNPCKWVGDRLVWQFGDE